MNQNDRGAALIQVALGLLAMIAFSTFVMDYGLFWTSRRQAQNAADSGALAGASALVGTPGDVATRGNATGVAGRNPIWGQAPAVEALIASDGYRCPDDPSSLDCVRVNVYRDVSHSNPLPIFFGQVVGLSRQEVKASAVAKVVHADTVDCLRDIAVLDLPSPGYQFPADIGDTLVLNGENFGTGWNSYLDFGGGGSTPDIGAGLEACNTTPGLLGPFTLGTDLTSHMINNGWHAGIKHYVDDIVALDPLPAHYDPATKSVQQSCVSNVPENCHQFLWGQSSPVATSSLTVSPRVIPLPVMDRTAWETQGKLIMVNVIGFFVEGTQGSGDKEIVGTVVSLPGTLTLGSGSGPYTSNSFIRTSVLIR